MKKYDNVWIALICVVPSKEENDIFEPDDGGAYVNVLSEAENLRDFKCKVKMAVEEMGLIIYSIQNCEIFEEHIYECGELYIAAAEAILTQEVQFLEFHLFPKDDPECPKPLL